MVFRSGVSRYVNVEYGNTGCYVSRAKANDCKELHAERRDVPESRPRPGRDGCKIKICDKRARRTCLNLAAERFGDKNNGGDVVKRTDDTSRPFVFLHKRGRPFFRRTLFTDSDRRPRDPRRPRRTRPTKRRQNPLFNHSVSTYVPVSSNAAESRFHESRTR